MNAIFFDLDGTLTDPFEGISRCILYALEQLDEPAPSHDDMLSFIGPPLQVTFRSLVGESRAGEALDLYRERFFDIGWQENEAYDGIHDALETVGERGAAMYVATTKPWVAAEKIVDHFGMGEFFERVFGSELDGTRIDKTELLAYAVEQESLSGPGVMIGDRHHDIIGGLNNNLATIGVSYGYGSTEELRTAGAGAIAARPADIPALLG